MRYQELKESTPASFIASKNRNEYITFQGLRVYLRKGKMMVNGEIKNAIQLANITNPKKRNNVKTVAKPKSTGKFGALMKELEKLAKDHGYDGVYVESILNDFLPGVLERYGYSLANVNGYDTNYWKM